MQKSILKKFTFLSAYFLYTLLSYAAVPSGYYYFAINKKKAALKTALHINCSPQNELEYGSGYGFTWEGFYYTDRNADNSVIDIYSNDIRIFKGFSSVDGMHIEHSFPKSWWGAYVNNAYKDLYHLYPADATTNITKNNLPLGEVEDTPSFDNGVSKIGQNGFGNTYTEKCFEPANEYKGDFARSYFYISTIYEELAPLMESPMVVNNSTYPFWKPWALDLLLKWHRQDPVSEKELKRIETIYGIQGNRNPFIDYPSLVEYIWGADTTKVFPFPEETEPFLLIPRRGATMDLGVTLENDTRSKNLHIQGVNLSAEIQLSLVKKISSIKLSATSVTADQALEGIDITVQFTPITAGIVYDTISIQGGGLTEKLKIPVKALASSEFITLEPQNITPIGGTLQWISEPTATDYHLKVYQPEQHAGDLIISGYVEGNSWNKALEIFNGTGKPIDLSKYSIKKQNNGNGDFKYEIKLSGMLQNFKSYILVNSRCTIPALTSMANKLDSLVNFNGNDAVVLTRGGLIIDQVGIADVGAAEMWGENISLERKVNITHPSSKYKESEWTKFSTDTYSFLENNQMAFLLSDPMIIMDVMTGKTTEYPIENLNPRSTYTYSVEAIKPGGITPAINTMQLTTTQLDAPEISEATNIQHDKFTANWGASAFATGYLLNVYKLIGAPEITETEGFDTLNDKADNLPTGWSGTVSGTYTGTGSTGISSPSIRLMGNEYLITKNYLGSVTTFTFMYKFASSSSGSSFIVECMINNKWVKIDSINYSNLTRKYPTYSFDSSQLRTKFRIRYNKVGGGNLSIDDVSATYGGQEMMYLKKDFPVLTTHYEINELSPYSQYFYSVKATLKGSTSIDSDIISVETLSNTKLNYTPNTQLKIYTINNKLRIIGLKGDEDIKIYTYTGQCIYHSKALGIAMDIPIKPKGVFLIKIQNYEYHFLQKILN